MPSTSGPAGGLSIIIPAFNEAARIGASLRAICAWIRDSGQAAEIVVVDDGSQDGTAHCATEILVSEQVAHQVLTGRGNRGKGFSIREGARAATMEWTLITDADLSTPIAEVATLMVAARAGGHALVMGSRGLAGSRIGVRQGWLRMNMGRSFNRVVRLITGLPFHDTQCGFKLWRTAAVGPLLASLRIDGFAWDVELLMAARRAGLSMAEVPVEWNNAAGSKVGLLRDPLRMLRDLIRLRLRRP
jgi:glycosyltransferase involved in cell wall biosynthesis